MILFVVLVRNLSTVILRNLLLSILSGTLLLNVFSFAGAQGTSIAFPEIISVSVDTGATDWAVEIKWKASKAPAIEKYTMFYDSTDRLGQFSWFPTFDTVSGDTRQWTFREVNPGLAPRSFLVQAIDSSGNRSNFEDWHTTVHLKSAYDSCAKQILLEWTSYRGWEDDLVRYDVYYSIDQGPYTKLEEKGPASEAGYRG